MSDPSHQVSQELSDQEVVDLCLQGDCAGWERLYALCSPAINASIRAYLGREAQDIELVDELAAQVWYFLVINDARALAQFDGKRNIRLTTYVSGIARNVVRNRRRSDSRRRVREANAARPPWTAADALISPLALEEVSQTLTAREKGYLDWCLAPADSSQTTFSGSENNDHQLRFRLRRRIHKLFGVK